MVRTSRFYVEIDQNIKDAIESVIKERKTPAYALSLQLGFSKSSVYNWLVGRSKAASPESWSVIYPLLKPYLPNDPKYKPMISEALQTFHSKSVPSEHPGHPIGAIPETIVNTAALRECIKDAMMEKGIRGADGLTKLIGYDSKNTIERLLNGKLPWFPDVLSCVLEKLGISHDETPVSNVERMLLLPEGVFTAMGGGILVRPIPLVDWCNASSCFESILAGDNTTLAKWNPDTTETVAVPVGVRKGTIAFRVHGISMETTLLDGDKITVEPRQINEIPNGKVVVVHFADCGKYSECSVCKRFRKLGDTILLTSDNPAGAEITTTAEDIAWIGVVTDYVRSI